MSAENTVVFWTCLFASAHTPAENRRIENGPYVTYQTDAARIFAQARPSAERLDQRQTKPYEP
jgi:hypothetical protein